MKPENVFIKKYLTMNGHIDITGHVSNVQYYEFFKSAIFSFLYDKKFSELNGDKDLWPIVLEESCKFKKEILFDKEIKVLIYFKYISPNKNKWLCIGEIYDSDNELCAIWESLHGILNRDIRKIEPMSETAYNLISEYTAESESKVDISHHFKVIQN